MLMTMSVQVYSQTEELHGSVGRRPRERFLRPVVRTDTPEIESVDPYVCDVCLCVHPTACDASLCCRWPCSATEEIRRSNTRGRSRIISKCVIVSVFCGFRCFDVSLTVFVFVFRARRGLRPPPCPSERPLRTSLIQNDALSCSSLSAFLPAGAPSRLPPAARWSFLSPSSRWRHRTSASRRSF